MRRLFRFMRKEDETVTGYCTRTARAARTISNKMKLPFLSEMIAGNMWSAMGWTCDSNPNAVDVEVRRWPNTKARNMTVDPTNHTRWKHKWWWHNRGCVWDKIASERAGQEEWSNKRRRCQNSVDKRACVTFAMMSEQHSVAHGPKIRESIKPNKERKEPKKLEPPDSSIAIHSEGTTVQMCGRNVAAKSINGHYAMGQKLQGTIRHIQKTLHPWWDRKIAYRVAQVDDYVKHIFRE